MFDAVVKHLCEKLLKEINFKKTPTQQSIISTKCQKRSVGFWEVVLSWCLNVVSAQLLWFRLDIPPHMWKQMCVSLIQAHWNSPTETLVKRLYDWPVVVGGGRDGAHIGSLFISSHVTGLTRHRSGLIPALSRPNRRTEGLCSVALPSFPGHYRL